MPSPLCYLNQAHPLSQPISFPVGAMVGYLEGAGARGDTGITAVPPYLERSWGEEKIPSEKPGRRENLPSAPSWGLSLIKSSQKLTGKGSLAMQPVGQHQDTEQSREEINAF